MEEVIFFCKEDDDFIHAYSDDSNSDDVIYWLNNHRQHPVAKIWPGSAGKADLLVSN